MSRRTQRLWQRARSSVPRRQLLRPPRNTRRPPTAPSQPAPARLTLHPLAQTKVLEAAKGVLGADGLPLDPEHAPDAAAAPAAVAPAPAPRSVVGRVGGGVAAAAQKPPGPSGGAAPATPGPSGPPRAGGGGPGAAEALTRRWGPPGGEADTTRHVLQSALDEMSRSGAPLPSDGGGSGGDGSMFLDLGGGGGLGSAEGGGAAPPSWAQSFLSAPDSGSSLSSADAGGGSRSGGTPRLRLQAAPARPAPGGLAFAEPELPPPPTAALLFRSQGEDDAARARSAVLPPLQSIMELTSAFRPPERGAPAAEAGEPGAAAAGAVGAGRALADGAGALPDGSTWEKKSGVEYGVVRGRGVEGRGGGCSGLGEDGAALRARLFRRVCAGRSAMGLGAPGVQGGAPPCDGPHLEQVSPAAPPNPPPPPPRTATGSAGTCCAAPPTAGACSGRRRGGRRPTGRDTRRWARRRAATTPRAARGRRPGPSGCTTQTAPLTVSWSATPTSGRTRRT